MRKTEQKRRLQERKSKYEHETLTDKAAKRTADATCWIAAFTIVLAIVGALTLYEVIEGGTDTHELAVQAKKQADAAKKLADRMKDQADRTKTIADQAIMQATAASSLAKTASGTLAVMKTDLRPYLFALNGPIQKYGDRLAVSITEVNYGKTPALHVAAKGDIIHGPDALAIADQWFRDEDKVPRSSNSETTVPPGPPGPGSGLTDFVASHTVEGQTVESLMHSPNFYVVVVGRLYYSDISGNSYTTDICFTNLSSGKIINCPSPKHNDIH